MLYVIAALLLVTWLFGLAGTYPAGRFVHVLLVMAVVVMVVGLLTRRRRLT